jgi:hypothetical protein
MPGAAGVITTDQPFQPVWFRQPTGFHRKGLAMTHLHWGQAVTGVGLQQQAQIWAAAFAQRCTRCAADLKGLAWAAFDL